MCSHRFKELILTCHPDKVTPTEQSRKLFLGITHAHNVLQDEDKYREWMKSDCGRAYHRWSRLSLGDCPRQETIIGRAEALSEDDVGPRGDPSYENSRTDTESEPINTDVEEDEAEPGGQ